MIYVLIVLWAGAGNSGDNGSAALSVEFNSKAHCRAAAAEIERQRKSRIDVIFCAEKGKQ